MAESFRLRNWQDAPPAPRLAFSKATIVGVLFALLCPVFFYAGPLLMPIYRLPFMLLLLPAICVWVQARRQYLTVTDYLVCFFVLWVALALLASSGFSAIQFLGFTAIETAGAFFVARLLVQNNKDLEFLTIAVSLAVLAMTPLAITEAITGNPIVLSTLKPVVLTHPILDYPPRMGIERAQVLLQHPIAFGLFVSSAFAPVLALSLPKATKIAFLTAILLCSVLSGSSTALLSIMAQLGLIVYARVFANVTGKWLLLSILVVLGYVAVDILSDRNPFHVFASYLTLDAHTAYTRIQIWNYGIQNAIDAPIFGIGLSDWQRPEWLTHSIDNFWLFNAVKFGFPGAILMVLILVFTLHEASRSRTQKSALVQAYCFSLVAHGLGAGTVHLWGPSYLWYFFMLGAVIGVISAKHATNLSRFRPEPP